MAVYKVVGSYEEFFEANIEADSEEIAQQIFYQNASDMTVVDGNWVDIRIDDIDIDEEPEYTMADYKSEGPKVIA
jgi:RecB family exonuclease